jgi:isopenicillin N synthase-like dioxygenase
MVTHSRFKSSNVLDELLSRGYAFVRLDPMCSTALENLYRASTSFFALDLEQKLRYSVQNRVLGYRPFAYANTGSVDKPDLNDSFLYWKDRGESLTFAHEISGFLDAAEGYRTIVAGLVHDVVGELSRHYAYNAELSFEKASVLQINSFLKPVDAEVHQYAHEDLDLLTVIWASAPGLELVLSDGQVTPVSFGADEVCIMPGSGLTILSGGELGPLHHQVRNHAVSERKSIMYFASLSPADPILPFVCNDFNRTADYRFLAESLTGFGISPHFMPGAPVRADAWMGGGGRYDQDTVTW